MKTTKCEKCQQEIRNCNIIKHSKRCDGKSKSPGLCKHCMKEYPLNDMANHSRWCDSNPKYNEYRETVSNSNNHNAITAMKEARIKSGKTNQFTKAKIEGTKAPEGYWKGKETPWRGRKHSEKSKQLMREKALASPHRRLRRKMIEYTMVNGKTVMLDSTWEEALALRLDKLQIKWNRPGPIKWIDDKNIKHNYFPDFYLIDYGLYLDPKNPIATKVQKEKIDILNKTYNNIIWINSLNECKQFNLPVSHRVSTPTLTE